MNVHDMNLYHTYFIFLLHTISHFLQCFSRLGRWAGGLCTSWTPPRFWRRCTICWSRRRPSNVGTCWNMLGHPVQRFKKRLYRKWSLFNGVFHVFFKLCWYFVTASILSVESMFDRQCRRSKIWQRGSCCKIAARFRSSLWRMCWTSRWTIWNWTPHSFCWSLQHSQMATSQPIAVSPESLWRFRILGLDHSFDDWQTNWQTNVPNVPTQLLIVCKAVLVMSWQFGPFFGSQKRSDQ